MKHHSLAIVLLLTAVTSPLSGAELVMDALVPSSTEAIAPGTYGTIRLMNTLPSGIYSVDTKVAAHAIPNIDLDKEIEKANQKKGGTTKGHPQEAAECTALEAAIQALIDATEEKNVPLLALNLQKARAKAKGASCSAAELAASVAELTSRSFATHLVLEKGSFVTVTANRLQADGTSKKIAEKVFDTGESGAVRTHLIVGMHPNKDQKWFAKQTAANEYTITRETDRDSHDVLGAVLFTWQPAESTTGAAQVLSFRKGNVTGSFAAGLGFDSNDPIYLFGYALNVTDSFGIAAGVAGFNQSRLKGIYKGDGTDKVSTNLQPDQLVEDTRGTGWFVGLTFRR